MEQSKYYINQDVVLSYDIITDFTELLSSCSQCAMRLTGYPSEEVMGHSLGKEFIRKEHQDKVQEVIDQTLHGEETA